MFQLMPISGNIKKPHKRSLGGALSGLPQPQDTLRGRTCYLWVLLSVGQRHRLASCPDQPALPLTAYPG